jgi:hypothetical protein
VGRGREGLGGGCEKGEKEWEEGVNFIKLNGQRAIQYIRYST